MKKGMMHEFRTHHAEFDGFSDFFAKEVQPVLNERDAVRVTAIRKGLFFGIVAGKNIRLGFDRNTLFIAIETGDQFEADSMFMSLKSPDRTQKILDEIGAIYKIVDTVLQPR